ncbi:MAG: hypothetical protein DRJ65_03250 [Acidobacteria bacterium]|nr:MAG: hypothetical protein DRJ65_03250 [Acidobacteriota bacterium]
MRDHSPVSARSILFLIIILFVCAPAAADSDCLEFVGRWPFGDAEGIEVVGDYAYFGSGLALVTVDISQPEPQVVATLDVGGVIWHLEAVGDSLYAAVGTGTFTTSRPSSVRLFDVSNPEAPAEAPVSGLEGYVTALASTEGLLAVTFRDPSALKLFDVTSPESPEELGSIEILGHDITPGDGVLFLAAGGLVVMDISDPQQITQVGEYHFPSSTFGFDESLGGIHIRGDYVYGTTSWDRLVVFDASDPTSPSIVGAVDGRFSKPTTSGDYIVVGARTERLRVFDVSDPTEPVALGSVAGAGGLGRIVASGDRVFGTSRDSGLHVVDITDPTTPVDIAHIPTPQRGMELAIIGTDVFAMNYNALRVFDLTEPENPIEVGVWPSNCELTGMGTVGDLVYLLSWRNCDEDPSTMSIIDVSEPSSPVRIGKVELPLGAQDAHASSGRHVFVTNTLGLIAVDVSDPTRPEQVGFLATEGRAIDVVIHGHHAFVADGSEGVAVIDINDPSRLHLVGEWHGSDTVFSLAVIDDLLLVMTGDNGHNFFIVDISNPHQPVEVNRMANGRRSLQIAGNRGYSFHREIHVVDLSWPSTPEYLESTGLVGEVRSGAVLGSLIVVSGHRAGLEVFRGCHLIADFSHQSDGDTIHFQDTTTGIPTSWMWDFGDGVTSTEQNPIYTFEGRCGYPVVSLTVSNDDGHHTTTARVTLGNGHCSDRNVAFD